MSGDLSHLYQEIILEHSRRPRNSGTLKEVTGKASGNNPLCGDRITIYLNIDGDRIADAAFEARGCAISVAAASLMTQRLKGQTVGDAEDTLSRYHAQLTDEDPPELDSDDELASLVGVREFPTRIKCATLPWETLRAALLGAKDDVTTE